jgi:hypothetical protein
MKGHQLVAVFIGNAEALGGVLLADQPDMAVVHPGAQQVLAVGLEILAHRAHHQRFFAQQGEAVGDIARHAAKFASHGGGQKGGGNLVQLIGQDLAVESTVKREQRIVGERPAYQERHAHSAKKSADHFNMKLFCHAA